MEGYIDMHCHILPGVDDGASDIREMKKMLRIAYDEGIRYIIATPHYHPERGHEPPEVLKRRLMLLRDTAHQIDEKFRIYLGAEILFGQDVISGLQEGHILTMNRRNYVLVEFSPMDGFDYIKQSLQQMQLAGYQIILAHVERYHSIREDIGRAERLTNMGIYLQVNADSITGAAGRDAGRFVRELMDKNLVFCVGTDAHDTGRRAPRMKKAAKYVSKRYGEEYMRRIFFGNAKRMLKKYRKNGTGNYRKSEYESEYQ